MKDAQWRRIFKALLNGEEINRVWASKQMPLISQPGNRCNELIKKGLPIQKTIVYPKGGARYVNFHMTETHINYYKSKLK